MVKKISAQEFDEVKSAEIAVVDFFADWCGPCKMLSPVLESLSEDYEGRVSFFSINVDENQEIAMEYSVNNIPNLILLKKGEKADQSVGFKPAEALKSWIDSNL
ncbi:MAG: thioredoxin [Lachnospiraceae bacterium]|nr:thioredoxin [Lachnospiraceae bacterium]